MGARRGSGSSRRLRERVPLGFDPESRVVDRETHGAVESARRGGSPLNPALRQTFEVPPGDRPLAGPRAHRRAGPTCSAAGWRPKRSRCRTTSSSAAARSHPEAVRATVCSSTSSPTSRSTAVRHGARRPCASRRPTTRPNGKRPAMSAPPWPAARRRRSRSRSRPTGWSSSTSRASTSPSASGSPTTPDARRRPVPPRRHPQDPQEGAPPRPHDRGCVPPHRPRRPGRSSAKMPGAPWVTQIDDILTIANSTAKGGLRTKMSLVYMAIRCGVAHQAMHRHAGRNPEARRHATDAYTATQDAVGPGAAEAARARRRRRAKPEPRKYFTASNGSSTKFATSARARAPDSPRRKRARSRSRRSSASRCPSTS